MVIALLGFGLALGFLPLTTARGADAGLDGEPGFTVWQLLVTFEFLVWAAVAIINVRNHRSIRDRDRTGRRPWRLLVGATAVIAVVLVPAHALGAIGPTTSSLGIVGISLEVIGVLAAAPAFASLDRIQGIASSDESWTEPRAALELTRFLRRRVRPAVASIGVAIAVALVVTSQIASVSSSDGDERQQLVLLYGGFFTVVLFVAHLWTNAAVDARSRRIVEQLTGTTDPGDPEQFAEDERYRAILESAFGLDRSVLSSFQDSVVVASPMIAALTSYVIG